MAGSGETTTIPAAAKRLGMAAETLYSEARRTGHVAGIRVIRVGSRMALPTAVLDRVLDGGEPGIESA